MIKTTTKAKYIVFLPIFFSLFTLTSHAADNTAAPEKKTHIDFFSPAPSKSAMHSLNKKLAVIINDYHPTLSASMEAIALPDSINRLSNLSPEEKKHKLVLTNSYDFLAAIEHTGPSWHSYNKKNPDLKFVARLYRVAMGVLTLKNDIKKPQDLIGKRIAVPARPSSLRVLIELLLQDGWGILEDVILVETPLPLVSKALANGEVDATLWQYMFETPKGFRPVLPDLMEAQSTYWVDIDQTAIDKMNNESGTVFERALIPAASIKNNSSTNITPSEIAGLMTFDQGLSAWESTNPQIVYEILKALDENQKNWSALTDGLAIDAQKMIRWPGIQESQAHEGAKQFYNEKGIQFPNK